MADAADSMKCKKMIQFLYKILSYLLFLFVHVVFSKKKKKKIQLTTHYLNIETTTSSRKKGE